ncbi:MAG: flagellar export protein FliJ [Ectothiorhodospiraceae bacterium]|nr:flagellar export protein FliJ [Ectothiorhodospiraceae bacterium]
MTRRKRMETVKGVMDDKAEQAARDMARVRQQHDAEAERLQQLQVFRDEYRRQFFGGAGASISAFRLRDFNAFIARLDEAIGQQQRLLQRLEQQLANSRTRWRQEQTRADAMDKVVDGYRAAERRQADRAEQRQQDELSNRRYFTLPR